MREFIEGVATLVLILIVLSLPISFFHVLGNSSKSCETKGYYLPATFLFCTLSEPK